MRPPGDPVRSDRFFFSFPVRPGKRVSGRENAVEQVIQPTSAAGGSAKSILLLLERNEDKENKAGRDLMTPKESVEQSMGGRINCGTARS